jgi:hypothetical protein
MAILFILDILKTSLAPFIFLYGLFNLFWYIQL